MLRVLLTPAPIVYTDAAGTTVYNAGALGATFISAGLLTLVGLIAFIATQAFTTGMAGAAWERGTATLADGFASFEEDAGRIILTAIGLIVLALVAVVLVDTDAGDRAARVLSVHAVRVSGGDRRKPAGLRSITESFRITTARFVRR